MLQFFGTFICALVASIAHNLYTLTPINPNEIIPFNPALPTFQFTLNPNTGSYEPPTVPPPFGGSTSLHWILSFDSASHHPEPPRSTLGDTTAVSTFVSPPFTPPELHDWQYGHLMDSINTIIRNQKQDRTWFYCNMFIIPFGHIVIALFALRWLGYIQRPSRHLPPQLPSLPVPENEPEYESGSAPTPVLGPAGPVSVSALECALTPVFDSETGPTHAPTHIPEHETASSTPAPASTSTPAPTPAHSTPTPVVGERDSTRVPPNMRRIANLQRKYRRRYILLQHISQHASSTSNLLSHDDETTVDLQQRCVDTLD